MNLTDKNREALIILMEECGEVVMECSKVLRFESVTCLENLQHEIADVLCMLEILQEQGVLNLDTDDLTDSIQHKRDRLKEWSSLFNSPET